MESALRSLNGRVVIQGDVNLEDHVRSIIHLIDMYKSDEMGESSPLSEKEKNSLKLLIQEKNAMEFFLIYLGEELVGGAICFEKFSSFAAQKIINIHDFFILSNYRGIGLGRDLMSSILDYAKCKNCSKVTLEVREDNRVAKNLYNSMGFKSSTPNMFFWNKVL